MSLKRIRPDALVFTSALWTRKAREIEANPHAAVVFFWSELRRQVQVAGSIAFGERALAEELYAERGLRHQLQAVVSRQGEPIEAAELEVMRDRLEHLVDAQEAPPACPSDWGTLILTPEAIELFTESPDRIHERRLFERTPTGWTVQLLAP